jgi:general stress protein 26
MKEETNLRGKKGIEKLRELVNEIKICMFSTSLQKDDWGAIRPMTALETDEKGNIWFLSDSNSGKNVAILKNNKVQLYFSHTGENRYLIINGEAEIITNQNKINDLWSPIGSIWFKKGKTDPNISVIKVNTKNAYYWDVEGNKMVNCFKYIASMVTGENKIESEHGFINL